MNASESAILVPLTDNWKRHLHLSVRARGCLRRADIITLSDLVVIPLAEFCQLRNCGNITVREVQRELRRVGLRLGMSLDGMEPRLPLSMSLRDYFASAAMEALVAKNVVMDENCSPGWNALCADDLDTVADTAYQMADTMLAKRGNG